MSVDDSLIEIVTKIANTRLQKRHPDITLKDWQTKEILEALILFQQEYEIEVENMLALEP